MEDSMDFLPRVIAVALTLAVAGTVIARWVVGS